MFVIRPNTRRRTILVTGFGAFPGAPRNPTETIVARLQRYRGRFERLGVDVHCVVLPVRFDELEVRLEALARELRPDAILHLGVAGRRRCLSVEMRAINRAGPLRPDASGGCPPQMLLPRAAQSVRATYPGLRILAALRASAIAAEPSIDAGDYVCNATLYRSLAMDLAPEIGFIHVPAPRRRALPSSRSGRKRPTEADLLRAACLAVFALARRPADARAADGIGSGADHRRSSGFDLDMVPAIVRPRTTI